MSGGASPDAWEQPWLQLEWTQHRAEGKADKLDLSEGRGKGGLAGKEEQDSREPQGSADLGAATSHRRGCGHWEHGWSQLRRAVSAKHTSECEVVFYSNDMPK